MKSFLFFIIFTAYPFFNYATDKIWVSSSGEFLKGSPFSLNDSLSFNKKHNILIDGGENSFLFDRSSLKFVGCTNLIIKNISVKFNISPSYKAKSSDLDSQNAIFIPKTEGYDIRKVEAITGWNPLDKRFSSPDKYFRNPPLRLEGVLTQGVFVLKRFQPSYLPKNKILIFRSTVYGRPVFEFINCSNIILENIRLEKSTGMGFFFRGCEDISLRGICFPTPQFPSFSSNADATHFQECRGSISFENCSFESMGDDAINVHGTYARLTEVISTNTIQYVTGRRDVDWPAPTAKTGDVVSIHHPTNPFGKPLVKGVVLSSQSGSDDKSLQITLGSPVSEDLPKDSVVWNQSTSPSLVVTKCRFLNNRARGILIQSSNARIEDNWFQGMTGPAIKVTCDVGRWWESGPSTNIIIRNNFISDCNDGPTSSKGAITVDADAPGLKPIAGVHRNIEISGNRIRDVGGMAISISSGSQVRVTQNRISTKDSPFIRVTNSTDVLVENNVSDDATSATILKLTKP